VRGQSGNWLFYLDCKRPSPPLLLERAGVRRVKSSIYIPLIPYMDSSFIASKFSQLMPTTEIMIAAIYPVS
jgi:hypothetical protein